MAWGKTSGCTRSSGYTGLVTTKETLHELIDSLSDDEAAELLARVSTLGLLNDEVDISDAPTSESFWEFVDALAARIPDEELKRLPPSDQIDEVVYRRHGR